MARVARWEAHEVVLLRSGLAEGLTLEAVSLRIGRTRNACSSKANELGIPSRPLNQPWLRAATPEERAALKAATKVGARGRNRERQRAKRKARGIKPPGGPDHPWAAENNLKQIAARHGAKLENLLTPVRRKARASGIRNDRKWAGIHWETGDPLPNTLDFWVRSAVRGKRGVVLDRAKTREVARLLGIPTEPGEDEPAHGAVADGEVTGGADLVQPYLPGFEPADGLLGDDGDLGLADLDSDE